MKFAKYLESESIPEWRKAYINYKGLKKRLGAIEKYRKVNQEQEPIQKSILSALESDHSEIFSNVPKFLKNNPIRAQSSPLEERLSILDRKRSLPESELRHRPSKSGHDLHNSTVLEEVLKYASQPEQYFFIMLDQDLQKISKFYDEKEKEAEAKYEALKIQVQIVHDFAVQLSNIDATYEIIPTDGRLNPRNWFKRRGSSISNTSTEIPTLPPSFQYNGNHHLSYNVARSRLKKATTEYYRSLELLKSYRFLNELGFRKILKKFDKTAGWKASSLYMKKVNKCNWINTTRLEEFVQETEKLYIDEFADGHRRKGMAKLRTPEKKNEEYNFTTSRIGFYIGLSLALFARVLQLGLTPEVVQRLPNMYYNLQIYGCFSIPILFCLGFALNTIVWTRSHINYKFIFEFNPRDNLDYHEFAELPSLILLILSITMYIDFSQSFAPFIPSEICPLIFFIIIIAIMICPFPILYHSSRRWLNISLLRIFLSYFFPIEFRDFFIADELNSLSYSFWTLTYFVCAYHFHWTDLITQCSVKKFLFTPFLACLPPWWRFLQCIRRYQDSQEKVHLVNALKYVTSIAATLTTGFRRIYPTAGMEIIWFICCIVNSTYTSTWDIKMDWGLFQSNPNNLFLRNDLVFYRWTYYLAIPINILLRFAWALNSAGLGFKGELIGFITALLEAYRRIQWNFFRLENEHINNCGNFRAIKEIPLPFAFKDYTRSSVSAAEEGAIRLPSEEIAIPPNALLANHPGYVDNGSFYGRRDFENKQDMDEAISNTENLFGRKSRQASMANLVLNRIRTKKRVESSDTDDEDGDSD